MSDMNERLQEIEQWKAGAEERLKTLFNKMGEQSEALKDATRAVRELNITVTTLTTQLAVLVSQHANRKDCPNPGLCKELEPRVAELEKKEVAFVGSWKGVAFVAGCGVTAVTVAAAVAGIIKMFFFHKP
jgi:uncharacterized coiled-coil protein SlyX